MSLFNWLYRFFPKFFGRYTTRGIRFMELPDMLIKYQQIACPQNLD